MPATISSYYASMLASRSLTVCWIIKITRTDSTVLAFTDHDQAITIDTQLYSPAGGLSGGSINQQVGTSQDTGELTALLSNVSGHIERADVLNGLYTNAAVQVGLADWATPGNGARYLGPMQITSCVISEGSIQLTIDTLDVLLKVDSIPTVTARCPVLEFGDKMCSPDGTVLAANRETLTVSSVSTDTFGQQMITFGGAPRIGGFFTRGRVKFSSGANNCLVKQVKYHQSTTGTPYLQYVAGTTSDSSFLPYIGDSGFSSTSTFTHSHTVDTSKVSNPAPTAVYAHARGSGGNWNYVLTGPSAGAYCWLRLHFVEWFYGASLDGGGGVGSRVFDVVVNGRTVLSYFDITQAAGGQLIVVIEEFPVTADGSGNIEIDFVARVSGPLIAAVELFHLTDTATVVKMVSAFPYTVAVLNTTVTTGASSATQTVGSTSGMTVGHQIYFAGAKAYRTIASISSSTVLVLTSSVNTTTAEVVNAGDSAVLTYGCDRSWNACGVVGNQAQFRGIGKDLPGADAISQVGRG